MTEMRILTVRQPAAWAIIHAGKDVENRTRSLGPYRGPVAIVAGREILDEDHPFWEHPLYRAAVSRETAWVRDRLDVRGAIIGVVDLVDIHRPLWDDTCDGERVCSPWAETYGRTHHLVLTNPRALDQPIAWRGALGLSKTDFEVVGDYLTAPWGHGPRHCTPYGCEPYCELEPVAKLTPTSAVTS